MRNGSLLSLSVSRSLDSDLCMVPTLSALLPDPEKPLVQIRWPMGLRKCKWSATINLSLFLLSTWWVKSVLHRSVPHSTMWAHDFVCRLDRSRSVMRALPHKMQASTTTLLCESEHQRDFELGLFPFHVKWKVRFLQN